MRDRGGKGDRGVMSDRNERSDRLWWEIGVIGMGEVIKVIGVWLIVVAYLFIWCNIYIYIFMDVYIPAMLQTPAKRSATRHPWTLFCPRRYASWRYVAPSAASTARTGATLGRTPTSLPPTPSPLSSRWVILTQGVKCSGHLDGVRDTLCTLHSTHYWTE